MGDLRVGGDLGEPSRSPPALKSSMLKFNPLLKLWSQKTLGKVAV